MHVSSSRENEISFDDEQKGGLATQFLRDCMLRDAVDVDGSGAISIDEIRMCAQKKIEKRLEKDPLFKLVAQKRALRSAQWMKHIGYTREAKVDSQPLGTAEVDAAKIQEKIDALRRAK